VDCLKIVDTFRHAAPIFLKSLIVILRRLRSGPRRIMHEIAVTLVGACGSAPPSRLGFAAPQDDETKCRTANNQGDLQGDLELA
jgi:hypothetical protein